MKATGIELSMSCAGNCYENATMESFWSTLKTETGLEEGPLLNRRQTELAVFDYIETFYNPVRRHSSLSQISPVALEKQHSLTDVHPSSNAFADIVTRTCIKKHANNNVILIANSPKDSTSFSVEESNGIVLDRINNSPDRIFAGYFFELDRGIFFKRYGLVQHKRERWGKVQ